MTKIMVVDDDPELLTVLSLYISSLGYEVLTADNGRQALKKIRKEPDSIAVVVSDVVMPEMDGYALCKELKLDPATQEITLVFVSQLSTLEEKIKGYEVGADDYIGKPVSPEDLGLRISKLIKLRAENRALQQQLSESSQIAMQAMTYSSDLGQILEFYKNSLAAQNFYDIAKMLFDVTNGYGLHCVLQIVIDDEVENFGSAGAVTPLEVNVIELSRRQSRFFDFGTRTIINYDDFSLLVKNMPIDNPERYGILKDSLGSLCNAVEARVRFLLQKRISARKDMIVNTVLEMMAEVDRQFGRIQQETGKAINSMMDDLDEAMLDLGLTSGQEELIRSIIVEGREASAEAFKQGEVMYEKFEEVRNILDSALTGK